MRAAILLALLLAGCTARLETADASLRPSDPAEIERHAPHRTPRNAGQWMTLTATLDRASVRRIAASQLYARPHIGPCGTATYRIASTPATIDGVDAKAFRALGALLDREPRRERFTLTALIYGLPHEFAGSQCLQLKGGGYFTGKLRHRPVPVRVAVPD